jgi:cytochrome P450
MSVEAGPTERSLFHQTPGEPYQYLRELRQSCPVYYDPLLRGYFLTRYDDVFEVMRDTERFRLQTRPEEQYSEHQTKARVATFRTMLGAKNMERFVDPVINPELDRLFQQFEGAGRVELHSELANPFPAHIIGRLFGLGEEDFADLLSYRDARSALFNAPPDATDIDRVAKEWQAKIDDRMREAVAAHRLEPRDNLLSQLLDTREDGEPIPDEEIIQIAVRDLLMAGSETATRSICNAVYRMLTIPGLYERLLADRSLVPALVEESLRYDPPVHVFWRAANADVELSGCPIAKDKQLWTSLAAANHDPAKFPDPEVFDITRKGVRHLTFSVGEHRCPGHWVGRNETELAVAAVLERLPNLRLDPDAARPELRDVILRCWTPLHLLFDAA